METTQETQQPTPGTASETPPKKRPGRPKGSKNKATLERERRAASAKKRAAKKQAATEPELPPEEPAAPVDDPLAVPVKPPDVPVETESPTQDEEDDAPTDSLGEDEAELVLEMLFGLYNSMTPMPVWLLIRKKVERLDQADAQAVWETCSEIARLTEDEKVVLKRALKPRVAALKLSEDERLLWTCGMIFASKVAAIMMATDPAIAAQYGAVLQATRGTA